MHPAMNGWAIIFRPERDFQIVDRSLCEVLDGSMTAAACMLVSVLLDEAG